MIEWRDFVGGRGFSMFTPRVILPNYPCEKIWSGDTRDFGIYGEKFCSGIKKHGIFMRFSPFWASKIIPSKKYVSKIPISQKNQYPRSNF